MNLRTKKKGSRRENVVYVDSQKKKNAGYVDPEYVESTRQRSLPFLDGGAASNVFLEDIESSSTRETSIDSVRTSNSLSDVLTGKYESLFDFTDDSEDKDAIMEDARIASKGAPSYFKVLLDDIEKHQKSKLPFSHSNRFGFGVKQGADGQFEQKDMVTGYGTEPLHHLEIYEPPGKKGPFTQSQLNSGELLFPSDEEESEDSTRMRHDYEGRTFYGKQPRTVDDLLHEHGHQRSSRVHKQKIYSIANDSSIWNSSIIFRPRRGQKYRK